MTTARCLLLRSVQLIANGPHNGGKRSPIEGRTLQRRLFDERFDSSEGPMNATGLVVAAISAIVGLWL
jgi:hypothetical protein